MEGQGTQSSSSFFKAYSLEITILVAALLVSSTMFVSFGNLSNTNAAILARLSAAPTTGAVVAGGSPNPPQLPAQPPVGSPVRVDTAGKSFKGDANARVTLVEFGDFQCPFCKRASPTVKQVIQEYGNRVKVIYMHYPLSFHQNAQKAAEAFECAKDQNKEWEMHDKLFELGNGDGSGLEIADLKRYAVDLGLDAAAFNSCLDSGSKASVIRSDVAQLDARSAELAAWGVDGIGTPFFLVNGKPLVGAQPYALFKAAIDAALAS